MGIVHYEGQSVDGKEACGKDGDGRMQVHISLDGFQGQGVRTIAPSHISPAELGVAANYRLVMDCSSNMGEKKTISNFILSNGAGLLYLSPGTWNLHLTVMDVQQGNRQVLGGTGIVTVRDAPTSASITLEPIAGTGTVSVEFTLPASVVKPLDPDNSPNKTITIVLLNDVGQEVANTKETVQVNANNGTNVLTYTANGSQVASGRYTLQLTSPYTVNNSSTRDQPVVYTMAWSDVLYVEGNRRSRAVVTIPGGATGQPGKPYRRTTRTTGGNAGTDGFTSPKSFNPWGETLWLYATPWDGNDSNGNGNEVLVVSWDPVFDADYYELELLLHPYAKYNVGQPSKDGGGRFTSVVETDEQWENMKAQPFRNVKGTQSSVPVYMRFSGGEGDPDHYRRRIYAISCLDGSNNVSTFMACADKTLARTMFATGGAVGCVNANYLIAQAMDAFDTRTEWSYGNTNLGKVGLEAGCSVLPVLLPSFAPRLAVVFRVRGVNRFGYSDWVYWKGGKW